MKPGHLYGKYALADGRVVALRALSPKDLGPATRFINSLVKERSTNRDLGVLVDTRVSSAEERKWLAKRTRDISSGSAVSVAAFDGDRLVGNCEVVKMPFRDLRRCGTLGIAVLEGHRGVGLGRRMLEVLLAEAGEQGVTLVELRVLAINRSAIRLYRSLGFRTLGRVPGKILRGRRHIDELLMFREQRDKR